MTPERFLKRLAACGPVLAGTLLIMLAVGVRGYPNVFTDTDNYYKQGLALTLAAGRTLRLVAPEAPVALSPQAEATRKLRQEYSYTSMGARSPFYGVFLVAMRTLGKLWLLAAVQALFVSWLVRLLWRTAAAGSPAWTYYALMAALAACTTMPFMAAFAVPDIFSAMAAMSVILLLVWRERLERWEQVCVWVLLIYALMIHASHMLLAVGLLPVGAALLWMLKAERRGLAVSAGLIVAAILGANLANAGFAAGFKAATGHQPRRPPFLMARVLADGPGRSYLKVACARGETLEICRFKDNPLDSSDDILWSNVKGVGVFNLSTPPQRVRMEDQETGFVLRAVAHDFPGQVGASLKNWGEQLVTLHLDDPVKDPVVYLKHDYWRHTWLGVMLREVGPCTAQGGCKPRIHYKVLSAWHRGLLVLCLAFLVFRATRDDVTAVVRRWDWSDPRTRTLAALALLLAAVVINAAVCGVLSGVFARYQARIAWMIPLAAGLLALAFAPASAWRRDRWEQAVAGVFGVEVSPAFVRFALVGVAGFLTDAVILHLLVRAAEINLYAARLVSFPIAVLVTWGLNRAFTFKTSGTAGKGREAAAYFAVQGAGGVANLGLYWLSMLIVPALRTYLLIPLVLGSAAGLCVTYLGSKHWAFRRPDEPPVAGV